MAAMISASLRVVAATKPKAKVPAKKAASSVRGVRKSPQSRLRTS
jgi:hypothetical protein